MLSECPRAPRAAWACLRKVPDPETGPRNPSLKPSSPLFLVQRVERGEPRKSYLLHTLFLHCFKNIYRVIFITP